jgi:hypothetical protein
MFFIIISALHDSGGFSAHHQELIKLYVQPWELSCFPAGSHDNTQGCTYSFITPDDGWKTRPKHVER